MTPKTLSKSIDKPAAKGILSTGSDIYICRTRIQSDSECIDSLTPMRISTLIAAEFAKYAVRVEHGTVCSDLVSEEDETPENNFDYVIKPVILEWSVGLLNSIRRKNLIKLEVEIYRVRNRRMLGSFIIQRSMHWDTTGIIYPCELLVESLEDIIQDLFI